MKLQALGLINFFVKICMPSFFLIKNKQNEVNKESMKLIIRHVSILIRTHPC